MTVALDREIIYPDSDGKPMADNTKQFNWIVLLKENLECLFANNPDIFVAGDLLWYPVEGHPEIRVAPDVLVALGRPKGHRGSYRQWQEGNQPPQVVFEVLSPGNTFREMLKKLDFYTFYGVDEYYIYDPNPNELTIFQRCEDKLMAIEGMGEWTSPLLGIHFQLTATDLKVYYPDRRPFLTTVALAQWAEAEHQRAETEKQRANLAEEENARLRELLRQAGIGEN